MNKVLKLLPGMVLAAAIMLVALPVAATLGGWVLSLQGIDPAGRASPISGVLVAILIGILVRNLAGLSERFRPGVGFCTTTLLRGGIILLGIRLSFVDVVRLGAWGIPIVITVIVSGLLLIHWFNRALGLPARLGTLIAAGTGICGITAIVSTAAAIDADEQEVAYAVANITLFGLLGMFFYPYLANAVLTTSEQVGIFLGTAVHETAQVVGAAMTYQEVFGDDTVLQVATVTKLTRNLFLAAVVPLLSYLHLRQAEHQDEGRVRVSPLELFPLFVLGFVGMSLLRSVGDFTLADGLAFGFFDATTWATLTRTIGDVVASRYLLGTAMAGVGLGTTFSVFRNVGMRPFAVGLVGAFLVGIIGLALAMSLGQFVRF